MTGATGGIGREATKHLLQNASPRLIVGTLPGEFLNGAETLALGFEVTRRGDVLGWTL
jgi:NAD(P)-dependent dehydrogenase (short-subunit alcohol dehydrogenase family)